MQILKKTGIDCRERRLISKLYTDQSVTVRLDQGGTKSVKTGRVVRKGSFFTESVQLIQQTPD